MLRRPIRRLLLTGSVDLVTVAQALHWFDLPRFYDEVQRVARPGGLIAVWCYQLHTISPRDRCDRRALLRRHRRRGLAPGTPARRGSLSNDRVPLRAGRFAAVSDGTSLAAGPGSGLPELVVGDAAVSKADRRRSARFDPGRAHVRLGRSPINPRRDLAAPFEDRQASIQGLDRHIAELDRVAGVPRNRRTPTCDPCPGAVNSP